jgi:lysophospholipase
MIELIISVGSGVLTATMNQSSEAQSSGTGGWMDAVTYMAGLSGGSWATGTYIANGGQLPNDMVDNVRPAAQLCRNTS